MSRILIDNPIEREFSRVPNVLWRWPGLSFKAKGFFAYLLSFHHGSFPPVAAMESETGLGRDARKAAMAELIKAGLAAWRLRRDAGGRVIEKYLVVSTRPLLAAVVSGLSDLSPENPSNGCEGDLSPENPSDGKSGDAPTETRRWAPENPAIYKDKIIKEGARSAGVRAGRASPLPASGQASRAVCEKAASLTAFQRARVLADQPCLVDGVAMRAGSPELAALRAALRGEAAGESRAA